jgi:hypothetical protein
VNEQGVSVPSVGRSFRCLVGELVANEDDLALLSCLDPPKTFDELVRTFSFAAMAPTNPLDTSWTRQALSWGDSSYGSSAAQKRKYKPVDHKVWPVPTYSHVPTSETTKLIEARNPFFV